MKKITKSIADAKNITIFGWGTGLADAQYSKFVQMAAISIAIITGECFHSPF